ncbi:hypothetical protein J7M02_05595, partial [Candidatus Aerophobetes bacterium]|nr:hypothetical protein [Candidatus Aerophobetes bacterium]
MRKLILGIDPGSYSLGLAFINDKKELIYSETVKAPSKLTEIARLAYLKGRVRSVLRRMMYSSQFGSYKIDKILYEDPHIQNASVTKILSEVVGAITTEI